MNRRIIIKYLFGILAVLFFSLPLNVKADIILPYTHEVGGCTKIVNISKYPDIILLSILTGPDHSERVGVEIISENQCLDKGYKFNSYDVYWGNKKDFVDKDLNSLDILANKDLKLVGIEIEFPGFYVSDTDPLVAKDIEYTVGGISNDQLVFYKSKQISSFNNGSPEKTELFDQNSNVIQVNGGGIFDLFNNKYWLAIAVGLLSVLVIVVIIILKRRRSKASSTNV